MSFSLFTAADAASIGVHPAAVAALAEYNSALQVYSPLVSSGAPSPAVPASASVSESEGGEDALSQSERDLPAAGVEGVTATTVPSDDGAAARAAVRTRLLMDITADYVCEAAFRRFFVDHKPPATPLRFEPYIRDAAAEPASPDTASTRVCGSPTRSAGGGAAPLPCTVRGPVDEAAFVCVAPEELHIDDMLWVVDNRKDTAASARRRTAWQTADGRDAGPVDTPSSAASPSTARSPVHGPPPPSAVGTVGPEAVALLRRNVPETREYFANAAAAESNFRSAVQSLAASATPTTTQSPKRSLGGRLAGLLGNDGASGSGQWEGGAVGGAAGLPPIAWRETLALNIITQWTFTLTIAVARVCSVNATGRRVPLSRPLALGYSTSEGASRPRAATREGSHEAKELLVVRHVTKRVYAQPTKAQFHTRDHRNSTGDAIDYPNIYFNVDDFDDEAIFSGIRLCEGYTLAVLLTAGATRDSNATIFRGALSYEVIMDRLKRDPAQGGAAAAPEGGTSRVFIPLVGPGRKGKAELSVSVGLQELEMSRQTSASSASMGPPPESPLGAQSPAASGSSSGGGGGFFRNIVDRVRGRTTPAAGGPPLLIGNEAIQCCLTYVSVGAQVVMDTIRSTDPARPRQWLVFIDDPKELQETLDRMEH